MVREWILPAQTPPHTQGCEGGSDRPSELLSNMRGQGDLGFLGFSPALLPPFQGAWDCDEAPVGILGTSPCCSVHLHLHGEEV